VSIETPTQAPESLGLVQRVALVLATAGGAGYAPVAPGTAGSAVAVPLFLPLAALHPLHFLAVVLGLGIVGIWAAGAAERIFGREDDGRIVIDEVVGQLLTLSPLTLVPGLWPKTPGPLIGWLVTGFVVFRVLDVWKPGPVRRAEQRFAGGTGVMLDDVLAGLIGAVVLGLAVWIVPALRVLVGRGA
jgi:phosphatidylglycerophosphatase A